MHCGKERKVRILISFCNMIMFKVCLVVGFNVKAHVMIYNLHIEIDMVTTFFCFCGKMMSGDFWNG